MNLHGTGGTLQTTEGERQTPALPKTLIYNGDQHARCGSGTNL